MRKILSLVVTLIALMVGCDAEQYVVWAPDGAKAAVIGAGGLHLCDPSGKLTPLLVQDVRKVAWFGDSTHIVAAREIKVSTWNQASKYLEAERIKRLEAESEKLFKDLMAQKDLLDQWGQALLESPSGPDAGDFVAMVLCMAEKHPDELKKKLTEEDLKKLQEGQGISITVIQMYELAASQAKDGPILASTFSKVTDLRPSPNGKVLAYVTSDGGERALAYLFVVPVDGAAQPTRVSDLCGLYADWSYDGRYVAYARANPPRAGVEDSLRLGTLRRMQVCEADGTLKAQVPVDEVKKVKGPDGKVDVTSSPAESLVGIVFNELAKVRCLRDGRIVFVSVEMTLPVSSDDTPTRLSLFAIDPAKQATVSRLLSRKAEAEVGDAVQYFEINPDQTLVAIPGSTGQITVVPLSGGTVTRMNGQLQDKIRMVPSWRGSDELCYAVGNKPQEQNGRAAEVYLWQIAREPRCISKDWPDEVVAVMKQN